jgi:hypothetical protein
MYNHDGLLGLENGIRNLKSIRLKWQYVFEVHDQTMVSIISALHSQKIVCPNNSSKESDWWNQLGTRTQPNTSFQDLVFHTKAHQHTWTVSDELSACGLNAGMTQRKARLRCSRNRVDFLRIWFRKEVRSICCISTHTETYACHWGFPFTSALLCYTRLLNEINYGLQIYNFYVTCTVIWASGLLGVVTSLRPLYISYCWGIIKTLDALTRSF